MGGAHLGNMRNFENTLVQMPRAKRNPQKDPAARICDTVACEVLLPGPGTRLGHTPNTCTLFFCFWLGHSDIATPTRVPGKMRRQTTTFEGIELNNHAWAGSFKPQTLLNELASEDSSNMVDQTSHGPKSNSTSNQIVQRVFGPVCCNHPRTLYVPSCNHPVGHES